MSETELKFLVDETTSGDLWVRVKALKLASNSPKTTRTLRSIYQDTSQHALRKAGIALRLRRDGRLVSNREDRGTIERWTVAG